jgi:hypothetical protein
LYGARCVSAPGTALVPGYTPVYVYELVPDIHTILVGPFHRVRYNIDIDTMFSPNPVPLGFMYLGFMYAAMPGWAPHTLLTHTQTQMHRVCGDDDTPLPINLGTRPGRRC